MITTDTFPDNIVGSGQQLKSCDCTIISYNFFNWIILNDCSLISIYKIDPKFCTYYQITLLRLLAKVTNRLYTGICITLLLPKTNSDVEQLKWCETQTRAQKSQLHEVLLPPVQVTWLTYVRIRDSECMALAVTGMHSMQAKEHQLFPLPNWTKSRDHAWTSVIMHYNTW